MTNITFEWIWKNRTQSLLLVFYFQHESSAKQTTNIRTEECHGETFLRHVFSWAPSHTEQGLIGSLLNLANIANGYKGNKKHELADKLMYSGRHKLNESTVHRLSKMIRGID